MFPVKSRNTVKQVNPESLGSFEMSSFESILLGEVLEVETK